MKTVRQYLIEEKQLAPATAETYDRRILRFEVLHRDCRQLSPEQVKEKLGEISISPSDHNIWVSALKHWAKYLSERDERPYGFAELLKFKVANKRLPKPLSLEEINRVCDQIDTTTVVGRRDRGLVELLYCGLRNSECCDSLLQQFADRSVRIVGKGDKERIVPLTDVAWEYILEYAVYVHGEDEDLESLMTRGLDRTFVALKTKLQAQVNLKMFKTSEGTPIYPRLLHKILVKYAKKAGVPDVHPHRLRHSFATHTLDGGLGNLIALKDVLGHSNLQMVNKYVLTSKTSRRMVIGYHPRQK